MIKGSAYVKRSRLPWGHQQGRLYVKKKNMGVYVHLKHLDQRN